MNKFEGTCRMQGRRDVARKYARGFKAQNRPHALTAGKNAVAHGGVDGGWLGGLGGQQLVKGGVDRQTIFLKKGGKFHRGMEPVRPTAEQDITIRSPARDQKVLR